MTTAMKIEHKRLQCGVRNYLLCQLAVCNDRLNYLISLCLSLWQVHAHGRATAYCCISNASIKSQWRHTSCYTVKAAQDVEILIAFHTALSFSLARKFFVDVNSISTKLCHWKLGVS